MADGLKRFMAEARRRRVFRTAGVYLVAVWGLSQGAVELAPLFGAPEWALRLGLIASLAFLPVVVVLAWMFDIGRSGIVRDPRDLVAQRHADDELASMPTQLGGDEGAGAVIVRWVDANGENATIFLDEFYLGRGNDCRVRFYDPLVSRKHARVYPDPEEGWRIEDLGSRNGTIVDQLRVERKRLEAESDVRLNEAGPVLRLELVAPGSETRQALGSFPPGPGVAHVRTQSLDFDRTRGSGA